jgi:predicted ATPase
MTARRVPSAARPPPRSSDGRRSWRGSTSISASAARQLVFITGEAGIGKTSLSEEFLRATALRDPSICILHGQCIQQHGPREPYMPVLKAPRTVAPLIARPDADPAAAARGAVLVRADPLAPLRG